MPADNALPGPAGIRVIRIAPGNETPLSLRGAHAAKLPITDCHIGPKDIYEDRVFEDIRCNHAKRYFNL